MNIPQVSTAEIENRVNHALAANAKRTVSVYPLLYLVLGVQSDFLTASWSGYWVVWLLLTLLSVLRFWQCTQLTGWSSVRWYRTFSFLALLHVLVWSLQVAYIVLPSGMNLTSSLWLIVTAGITAGGSSSLSPSRSQAIAFTSVGLVPVVLALLWVQTEGAVAFALCMVIFLINILSIAWQQSALYRSALLDNLGLELYAQALEESGRTDALTGLFNRGYFNEQSQAEWRRSARNGQSLALLLLDIDHFKSVNDRHGHLVGDRCLQLAASLLKNCVRRPSDLVARFGGEEFVLLLPETDVLGAQQLAEGVVQLFEQRGKPTGSTVEGFADIEHIGFTVSVGVVAYHPAQGGSVERLLDCGDKALYRAKAAGRNQVSIVDEQQLQQAFTEKVQRPI